MITDKYKIMINNKEVQYVHKLNLTFSKFKRLNEDKKKLRISQAEKILANRENNLDSCMAASGMKQDNKI